MARVTSTVASIAVTRRRGGRGAHARHSLEPRLFVPGNRDGRHREPTVDGPGILRAELPTISQPNPWAWWIRGTAGLVGAASGRFDVNENGITGPSTSPSIPKRLQSPLALASAMRS
jgi:hypothetical protein